MNGNRHFCVGGEHYIRPDLHFIVHNSNIFETAHILSLKILVSSIAAIKAPAEMQRRTTVFVFDINCHSLFYYKITFVV